MDQTPVPQLGLYFLSSPAEPACFAHVKKTFAGSATVELKSDVVMDDLLFQVRSGKKCVAILTISDRNDLASIVNGLFTLKKDIRERRLMVVVFLKFGSEKVEDLLMRSGVSEILKFDVNAKAFTYKINRFIKLLDQEELAPESVVSLSGDKSTNTADQAKKLGSSNRLIAQNRSFQVVLIDAWTGTNDFWLFRKKVYAKKYQDKWLIEIIGPSPAAGSWEKMGENHYQWQARPGFDFFDVTPGNWEFRGSLPTYSWVINRWAFVSDNPSLGLINRNHIVYSRFHLRDANTIEVPKNSEYARSIFQKIKDTYDRDYLLKMEKASTGELQGTLSHDTEIPWADKTNSIDLQASDWNVHDLSDDESPDYGQSEDTEYLMGAEAMAACGISGTVKTFSVELLEYNEIQFTLTLGVDHALVESKEVVDVVLASENLDLPKNLSLKGVVTSIGQADELGKTTATVMMLQSSKDDFKKIRDAVNRRQAEVLSFFKKARGLD